MYTDHVFSWLHRLFCYYKLAKLKESDVSMYPEHIEIFVESSKMDQLRDSAWVVTARTNSKLCQFGLHSLRAGGASAAANAGIADRFFKQHGRRRSENAKDGYVRDSLKERLKGSQCLGLSDGA